MSESWPNYSAVVEIFPYFRLDFSVAMIFSRKSTRIRTKMHNAYFSMRSTLMSCWWKREAIRRKCILEIFCPFPFFSPPFFPFSIFLLRLKVAPQIQLRHLGEECSHYIYGLMNLADEWSCVSHRFIESPMLDKRLQHLDWWAVARYSAELTAVCVQLPANCHVPPVSFYWPWPCCYDGGLKTRDGQKCRVGKRGTGKRGTKLQDWKMQEKAYGKPNDVLYM